MIDHDMGRWICVGGGVAFVVATSTPWNRIYQWAAAKLSKETVPQITPARPRLALLYDPNCNFVRHEDGSVDVRMAFRQPGPEPVKFSGVKINGLEALTNADRNSPYAAQYTGCPLKLERPPADERLVAGELFEFRVVQAERNAEWFYFCSSEGQYRVPRGRYVVSICVTADGAEPCEQLFIIDTDHDGELKFEQAERLATGDIRPTISRSQTRNSQA
ncbi:MAG: hypothetical protein AB7O68_10190 [Pirellulales bacterium]